MKKYQFMNNSRLKLQFYSVHLNKTFLLGIFQIFIVTVKFWFVEQNIFQV